MHTHVSQPRVSAKKTDGSGGGRTRSSSSRHSTARSARRPRCSSACLLTHQGHMRACAVGVKGRGAAVEVRRQCSTSVDDMSTAPLCGRDAATRGAEFEAGRHGGSAEFEAAAPTIPSFTSWRRPSRRARALRLGTVIKSRRENTVAGRGPVSGHHAASRHTECGETSGGVSAHRLPNTLKIGLGRVD